MLIRFWGTRGSLPTSLGTGAVREKVREAIARALDAGLSNDAAAIERFVDSDLSFAEAGTFGGNTSCVQVAPAGTDQVLICDAGSGLRELGIALQRDGGAQPLSIDILLSHLHWDHIMGFPFFTPAFVPGNRIRFHACHEQIEQVIRAQNSAPCFPVDFSALSAQIEFNVLTPGEPVSIAGCTVRAARQRHGGDSYGYRIEQDGKAVVYSTDGEHKLEKSDEIDQVVAFFQGADLVIFDAMYSLAEAVSVREDWGHSSNLVGVDLCLRAGVKHYCMFHHEPMNDDGALARILAETRRYEEISRDTDPLVITTAYDGLEIEI